MKNDFFIIKLDSKVFVNIDVMIAAGSDQMRMNTIITIQSFCSK